MFEVRVGGSNNFYDYISTLFPEGTEWREIWKGERLAAEKSFEAVLEREDPQSLVPESHKVLIAGQRIGWVTFADPEPWTGTKATVRIEAKADRNFVLHSVHAIVELPGDEVPAASSPWGLGG